jgi:rsbT co-antagonist protein RsbR
MRITQRNITIGVFLLLIIISVLVFVNQLVSGQVPQLSPITAAVVVVEVGLLAAYLYGWEPARYLVLLFVTLMVAFFIRTDEPSVITALPSALALVLARPAGAVGSAILVYVVLLARAYLQGPYAMPPEILSFILVIGTIVLGHVMAELMRRAAEENARRTASEQQRAEEQSRQLASANEEQQAQLDQQRKLIALIETLETPAMSLAEGLLFAPIVGQLDSRRAHMLTSRLLSAAHDQRARTVVLDIAGVSAVDAAVAQALLDTARSLRLLGCEVLISGITAPVATTLMQLDVRLEGIETVRSPQEALTSYLKRNIATPGEL